MGLGTARAPQTHSQGAALDHSTMTGTVTTPGAPQSYPPPGHPTAGAPQAYQPIARAPQLYSFSDSSTGGQANTGASPQVHPSPTTPGHRVHAASPQDYSQPATTLTHDYNAPFSLPPPPKNTPFPTSSNPSIAYQTLPPPSTPSTSSTTYQPLSPPPSTPLATYQPLSPPPSTPSTTHQSFSPPPSTPSTAYQSFSPPPSTPSIAYQTLPPPPPPKDTSASIYFPSVLNNTNQLPPIANLPVVNTPYSPPSHHIGYSPQSSLHPPPTSHATTGTIPHSHYHTPHIPVQYQHQHQQQPTHSHTAHHYASPAVQPIIFAPQQQHSIPQSHQQHPPHQATYAPATVYGTAGQPVSAAQIQQYPQRPIVQQQQPTAAPPMFYPVRPTAVAASPPSFRPPSAARVCCITFNEHNKIRLIGANLETVSPLRHAIAACGVGLTEDAPIKNDGHEYRLTTRPWHTKEADSISPRLLLLAILKSMAHCRWNVIQAVHVSKMDSDKDFVMFESIDSSLGAVDIADVDMFVMSLMGKDKIQVIGAGPSLPAVVGTIKQAFLTHWKHSIKKEVAQEKYHEFQMGGDPWAPSKSDEAMAKICMAQLLANVGSLGFKLYVSLDIYRGSKDSENECLVFRRIGRVWR